MNTNEFACGTSQGSNLLTKGFAMVALLLVAVGCRATAPQTPLSDSAVRLDLPLVRQDALYDCGLASISALCQYWGVQVPDDERIALARTAAEEKGLSGAELCTALQGFGLETYLFQGSLDREPTGIYAQVDAGRPPLVMVSADGIGHHYEMVLGYDEPRANLILLDPVKGEILVPVVIFARNWERCQRFTLLACRKQAAPEIASVRDEEADPTSNPAHTGN
jgi:ABC-type bacteriocin/lantibiotic exporter with double-glycine peptidase domain